MAFYFYFIFFELLFSFIRWSLQLRGESGSIGRKKEAAVRVGWPLRFSLCVVLHCISSLFSFLRAKETSEGIRDFYPSF
jgi:hypothetical protein